MGDETWYVWSPDLEDDPEYEKIAGAVEEFESLDTAPGRDATRWLREEALDNHPSTITRLMVLDDRVEGFYAISSAHIRLSQRHRKRALRNHRAHRLHPEQPASLIPWLAKRWDAKIDALPLILHAAYIASEVAELQGNIALAIDPYDEDVAEIWTKRYGFRASSQDASEGKSRRLWLPLF